ncbi:hypothetical protein HMPREF1624_05710 [Sporothrix schenckii ATCC 58251]|uniref:FCH domain-containing protein n=1 Tax=Sporothrix schenckii (strain ATCC 58251 / de Perez 2211183) TaxID=1391915 RepID=U7PRI6_SPOS1|nr:hypothetical protein HMPREF1624_05710 [Sporothrix schenckii ATCC 58251]
MSDTLQALQRTEYAGVLPYLQPAQAVQVLQERIRRISKVNTEIADFLAERRRVEEQYVAGLKKLVGFKVPASSAELGVFQPSWDSLLRTIESTANSHQQLSRNIGNNVESPLRNFQAKDEVTHLSTMATNLHSMAKELDDAQNQVEKLTKKGGKANVGKVDAATQRLDGANQQWENQAPFIFESLQALDESRVNHLRDLLTQLGTHEVDLATTTQSSNESLLGLILDIKTDDEITNFSQRVIDGRPRVGRFAGMQTRQSSIAASASGSAAQPQQQQQQQQQQGDLLGASAQQETPATPAHDTLQATRPETPPTTAGGASAVSGTSAVSSPVAPRPSTTARSTAGSTSTGAGAAAAGSVPPPAPPSREATGFRDLPPPPPAEKEKEKPEKPEKNLRSRIGTMLGRRRQSIHGGFGQLIGSKNSGPFNRISVSSHGQSISPRASYNNLSEAHATSRLGSVAEASDRPTASRDGAAHTNGTGLSGVGVADSSTLNTMTVNDIFGVPPPPGPPPSQQRTTGNEPARDAEGYSLPLATNDPISQAQRDAAAAGAGTGEPLGDGTGEDRAFQVNIQKEPVQEEDPLAKRAALSNMASTLSQAMPSRRGGTVRGRRDVRNTIYVPQTSVPESLAGASPSAGGSTPSSLPNLPGVSRSSTFASLGSTATPTRPPAVSALASESSLGGGTGSSDTQSVRSTTSLSAMANLKHVDSDGPGLHASIIESVSASFENGEVASAKIAGEIAFSYTAPPASPSTPPTATTTIRINNFPLLESIGPNRIFVQNTSSPDQFTLDTSHLQSKAAAAFTFRAHAENPQSLAAHCPLAIKPVWKPMDDQLRLMFQYRLNPNSRLAPSGQPVVLRNVVFFATYEGRASTIASKPSGTHVKDRHLVYWRLPSVTLTAAWSKIACAIRVEAGGAVPQPGNVEARWEYAVPAAATDADADESSITISQLQPATTSALEEEDEEQDPFADDSLPSPKTTNGAGAGTGAPLWTDVPLARQIVSGSKYEGK